MEEGSELWTKNWSYCETEKIVKVGGADANQELNYDGINFCVILNRWMAGQTETNMLPTFSKLKA